MWTNPKETEDLITFKNILNGKLPFCAVWDRIL